MTGLKDLHLAVFSTRGVSLQVWDEVGLLSRETALFRALGSEVGGITLVTYGTASDLGYRRELSGISIQCNRWRLPLPLYERWLQFLAARRWPQPTIVRSNQVVGADIALGAALCSGQPFVARCGYLHSDFTGRKHGLDSLQFSEARALEQRVFTGARRVVVTTQAMKTTLMQEYRIPANRIAVVPNYVQTDVFRPRSGDPRSDRICFIGRLEHQKNLISLLEAVDGLDVELVVVGGGRLREPLEARARHKNLRVQFLGNLPHEKLPQLLSSVQMFILPSHYEGHPKAILEAMACGCPVVGTNVTGIRELIRHRETGLLCGTSPAELRASILELKRDPELRARLGNNARAFVNAEFSLGRIVELELRLYESILAETRSPNLT